MPYRARPPGACQSTKSATHPHTQCPWNAAKGPEPWSASYESLRKGNTRIGTSLLGPYPSPRKAGPGHAFAVDRESAGRLRTVADVTNERLDLPGREPMMVDSLERFVRMGSKGLVEGDGDETDGLFGVVFH